MIEYGDAKDLVRILESRGVRGFEIGSSLGLGGWVLATAMELRPRDKRLQGGVGAAGPQSSTSRPRSRR